MDTYKIFRVLNFFLLFLLFGLIIIHYQNWISQDSFVNSMTIVASFVTFSAIFATKPLGAEDVSVAVDKVLLEYESKTYETLKERKEEEQKISEFIENKSNEIFLLKIRSFMEEEILRRYENSELPKMVNELEKIEKELDLIDVHYNEIELPIRFKKVLQDLNYQDQVEMYADVLDTFPFLPSKKFIIGYIKMVNFILMVMRSSMLK